MDNLTRAAVFLSLLTCTSPAWSMSSNDLLTQCSKDGDKPDIHACIVKLATSNQKVFDAAGHLTKSKLEGWVADDDHKKASSDAYDAALAAYKDFRRQQCEAYASTAGSAASNVHDTLQKACEAALDGAYAAQQGTALANLPQRGSWLGRSGSLVDYAEPFVEGRMLPDCAKNASNKMHPDIVLMNCYEGRADESAKAVKPAVIDLLRALKAWNDDADRKELSSALYKVAKPSFDAFSVKQAIFIGSLVIEDSNKGKILASMASQINWNSFYVDQLVEVTKRASQ